MLCTVEAPYTGSKSLFVANVKTMWEKYVYNTRRYYHCIVRVPAAPALRAALEELYPKPRHVWLPYRCDCDGENKHVHAILGICTKDVPLGLTPSARTKIRRGITGHGYVSDGKGYSYKLLDIRSRCHLVSTILYIQTVTNRPEFGCRSGHYNHRIADIVIRDYNAKNDLRDEFKDGPNELPGFKDEARREWDEYCNKRRTPTKLDDDGDDDEW